MGELSRRYQIRRVLGRGGQGTVYEALDTKTDAVVALKAVEAPVADAIDRFKHEFRALTEVQHQNLIHYGELACEDGAWFFTMELVAGTSFIDHVRPRAAAPVEDAVTRTVVDVLAGSSPSSSSSAEAGAPSIGGLALDEDRLRRAMVQLVDALSVLHDTGRIHRDIKPSNVMVSDEGRVVVLDFGLVKALTGTHHHDDRDDRSGTPAYMAPEQAAGGDIGPPADWYAVGTMLYIALTGRPPFPGTADDVLAAKMAGEPVPPHDVTADIPIDLDALCIELLRRDPAQRPTDDALRAGFGLPPRVASPAEVAAPFVGRHRERAVLLAALTGLTDAGAAIVIEGEPGVGKSALVQQVLGDAPADVVVLRGRCYEQESTPFKGVDSVVETLADHLATRAPAELERLLAGGVRYLATVFPVLRRVAAIQAVMSEGRTVASQAGLREHAFGELAQLIGALGGDRPLVIFLDDLQWVDADSMALLERAVLGARCLFVATLRPGLEVDAAVARLRDTAIRIELRGLPSDEAHQLWAALRPGRGDSTETDAIREAEGHPLLLAELARAASAGRLAGGALLDVLRERIRLHDPIERDFLEMAAVAGAPTPYDVLARAAELDVGDCLTRLGGLKAAQLIRISRLGDDRCVEPYHDRIREALVEPLRAAPRRAATLQLRLGRALLAATPAAALPARVFAIVHHLDAARALLAPDERLRVAELMLLASREARLATAYDRARDHARRGLELIGLPGGWSNAYGLCRDLHMARMEAEFLAGDHAAAREVFDAARPQLGGPADTAALWAAWLVLETARGRFREAIEIGRAGLHELGFELPLQVSRDGVLAQYHATRGAQAERTLEEIEAMPRLVDPRLEGALLLLVALGPVAFFVDSNLMAWINMRIAEESMRRGMCDGSPFGLAGYGMILAGVLDQPEEGAAFGGLALRVNERDGQPRLAAKLYLQRGGYITHWVRPYADARAQLRTAYDLSIRHGDAIYEVYAATILSVVTFCESATLAAVQETGEWAREIGARRKIKDMAAAPAIHARYAATLRGDGPLELGDDLRASLDDSTPVAMFYYHFCRADLARLRGDLACAEAALSEARTRTRAIYGIPTTVELAFLEALVLARRIDAAPAAGAELRAQLAEHSARLDRWAVHCPANYEPHALIVRGELARIDGRGDDAARELERAVGAARRSGAARREAIALERAAACAEGRGDLDTAARDRRAAADAFQRWGAPGLAAAIGG